MNVVKQSSTQKELQSNSVYVHRPESLFPCLWLKPQSEEETFYYVRIENNPLLGPLLSSSDCFFDEFGNIFIDQPRGFGNKQLLHDIEFCTDESGLITHHTISIKLAGIDKDGLLKVFVPMNLPEVQETIIEIK